MNNISFKIYSNLKYLATFNNEKECVDYVLKNKPKLAFIYKEQYNNNGKLELITPCFIASGVLKEM